MKILVVKTSSLGDVLHTLPALTDAAKKYPEIRFDWVVEEAFAEIPAWHPRVDKVIPIAWRRWRKQLLQSYRSGEWQTFFSQLRATHYDRVIDAQGLMKSGLVTRLARGLRCGLDKHSAWEFMACLAYQKQVTVAPQQHAIDRVRQLFAAVLDYSVPDTTPDYGVLRTQFPKSVTDDNYLVFAHGTTWASKHWPESYWKNLVKIATNAGYTVCLPWGNAEEQARAQRLASVSAHAVVLPKLNLRGIAGVLAHARAVVAVDTGLGHMAAALNIPTVSLYGPTDPSLTGTRGESQQQLAAQFPCAPCLKEVCHYSSPSEVQPACFSKLSSSLVWQQLSQLLQATSAQ